MADVWVVRANCGDAYCGCGLGHLVAVASTEERAKALRVLAAEMHDGHKWPNGEYRRHWDHVDIEKVELDALRAYDDTI